MTFFVENNTGIELEGLDYEEVLSRVTLKTIKKLECPYEAEVNLTLTDNEDIRELNRDFRDKDAVTDVLSFPMVSISPPADFNSLKKDDPDVFNPETGELMLGDIVINLERVIEQAEEYGHSTLREFAFLIVHSVLHLLGFDHENPDEEIQMFTLQEEILDELDIIR